MNTKQQIDLLETTGESITTESDHIHTTLHLTQQSLIIDDSADTVYPIDHPKHDTFVGSQTRRAISVFLLEENMRVLFVHVYHQGPNGITEVYFLSREIIGSEDDTLEGLEVNGCGGDINSQIIRLARQSPSRAIAKYYISDRLCDQSSWREWRGWKEQGPVIF